MDDDLGHIDIEGKNLAVSAKDIQKLTTENGCELKIVDDKVHNIDDTLDSDFENDNFLEEEFADKFQKQERWKNEYISLALNANRDPIKPGQASQFTQFQKDHLEETETETFSFEENHRSIHEMYENMGPYEDYLKTHDFEEISPGRVFKRKLVPGVECPINETSLVMYNCALWSEKSTKPFDSTWLRQSVQVTNMANDSVLAGLYELLLTMKKGETCEAFIRPEAAFGRLGAMPRIPPNAVIFCVVEIVRVVLEDKLSIFTTGGANGQGLTFEDFYSAGDVARQRGNYYYENNQFRPALQRYKSGIRLLESISCKNEEEEQRAKGLLVKLHNNCARAANAAGFPRLALSACKRVSEIDDMVPKTYWLRMNAWRKRGHLDRALGVARRAIQLFSDSRTSQAFQVAAKNLKQEIEKNKADLDDLHRLMGAALLASN